MSHGATCRPDELAVLTSRFTAGGRSSHRPIIGSTQGIHTATRVVGRGAIYLAAPDVTAAEPLAVETTRIALTTEPLLGSHSTIRVHATVWGRIKSHKSTSASVRFHRYISFGSLPTHNRPHNPLKRRSRCCPRSYSTWPLLRKRDRLRNNSTILDIAHWQNTRRQARPVRGCCICSADIELLGKGVSLQDQEKRGRKLREALTSRPTLGIDLLRCTKGVVSPTVSVIAL